MPNSSKSQTDYSPKERIFLWTVALISFFVLNIAFGYGLIFDRDHIIGALKNPIALAFICEAFLLMATLGYLLSKWEVSKLHWRWFILLSIIGSMGFALPVVLLWQSQTKKS